MAVLFENNASTTLSATLTNAATGIACTDISTWPSPTGSDYIYATIQEGSTVEIIKATGRSGNRLTPVTRAQDGTSSPSSFSTSARIEMRVTEALLETFLQTGEAATVSSLTVSSASSATLTVTGTEAAVNATASAANSQPGFRAQNDARSWLIFNDGATSDNLNFRDETAAASRYQIDTSGRFLGFAPLGGIGYGTGAGGTVSQGSGSGKATAVELNKVTGLITMDGAVLNAGVIVSFTLTNSVIAATDTLILQHQSGGTVGAYTLSAQAGAGSAVINVRNATAGNLTEAPVIRFTVIKSVSA